MDERAIDAALRAERFLLFKHSNRCSISARAFREYEAFVAAHPETPAGWIDVVAHRPLSLRVAECTGVAHQSPQALWIRDGAVSWRASHTSITRDALEGLS
jgi:bacillithiol system protein YtxJ